MTNDPLAIILPVMVILFISTFTKSALGFGDALIAMPVLVLLLGVQTATPLVAFVAITIAMIILLGNWHNVHVNATWRLILSSLPGIPLGLLLLKFAPEFIVKSILGGILILFSLYKLFTPKFEPLRNQVLVYPLGFLAGILGGAYNTNGPPIAIYGALSHWSPEKFRASFQFYFFATGWFIIIGHGLGGLWTPAVFRLYGYALPMVMLAIFLGGRLNRLIPQGLFERLVYLFLIIIGIFLILNSQG